MLVNLRSDPVAAVHLDAADNIETNGLSRGAFKGKGNPPPVCPMEAICRATDDMALQNAALIRLRAYVLETYGLGIPEWADASSQADVVAGLRASAVS